MDKIKIKIDPKTIIRRRLFEQLERYGCERVNPNDDVWWVCNVCGYPVYLEIPRGFPAPGVTINAWFEKHRIPEGWFNLRLIPEGWSDLRFDEIERFGKTLVKICVYTDPLAHGDIILANVASRMREIGIRCGIW